MMTRLISPFTALSLVLTAVLTISVPTPSAAQEPTATPEMTQDESVQLIVDRFLRLYRSIQATGGIDEENRPHLTAMLDEVEAARVDHPDSIRLTAVATQLVAMLEDDDRVFDLFDQLMRLAPENEQVAQDWLTYFRQSDSPERADDVIDRLLELDLRGPALRRTLASHLKQDMQYDRAIAYLQGIDLDPSNNPEAIVTLAECLFAQHQFAEASELLNSIPQTVLEQNPQLGNRVQQHKPNYEQYIELWQAEQELRSLEAAADDLPRAELITEHGRIVVELFENEAPNTVANFITLAEEDFYDATAFHRVLVNFMAQGGDPLSREGAEGSPGTGGPGYYIPDEHTRDDHRMHFSGNLSMAKTALPNTAGSGFYLTFEPTPWLNGKHTVFGRVIEGFDVVRQIRQDDELLEVNVLRKREHDYTVEKIPLPGQSPLGEEQPTEDSEADAGATDRDAEADSEAEQDAGESSGAAPPDDE